MKITHFQLSTKQLNFIQPNYYETPSSTFFDKRNDVLTV